LSIQFYYEQIKFRIYKAGEVKKFLGKVITEEKKIPGDLLFIFTNDETILGLNKSFLGHDYYTDIISFDYSSGNVINGEIYISIDTVKRNADVYEVNTAEELWRVMIHGVLHLCGYRDKNNKDRNLMFLRQEKKLNEFIKRHE
jgi:probable rRNA maturation factor